MTSTYRKWIRHSARIAVAASLSLAAASLLTLPESYWAPLTTIIVMESTLGAAWEISKIRLIGTAIGAFAGCALALCLNPGPVTFGIGLFALGLLCGAVRLNRSAYRFAGITLAIVFLVAHGRAPWLIALDRFVEVSLGIAVALIMTAIWPDPQQPPATGRS